MPYYRWKGVNLRGDSKRGTLFARSIDHLDALLFKRHIALLYAKKRPTLVTRPITLSHHVQLFQQLSTLIEAGVLIPDALHIVSNQTDHPQLAERVFDSWQRVVAGESLSAALKHAGAVDRSIILQLIRAGEESGKLPLSLQSICAHLVATQDFYQKLRSALLLPAVTLGFFLTIIVIIFTFIMPRFIDIYASMNSKIPPLTQSLLRVSDFIKSPAMGLCLALIALAFVILWRITRRGKPRKLLDAAILQIPFVGPIVQERFLSYMLRATAVLLEGGMPLSQALKVVRKSVSNHIFREYLAAMEQDIAAGASMSEAMAQLENDVFTPDTLAMVEVGQESGRLSMLLQRASLSYHRRVMNRIARLTLLVQPTIMLLLGLLVAVLIFAVYGPIFNMSRIV